MKICFFSLCSYGISLLVLVLVTVGQILLVLYVLDLKIVYKTIIAMQPGFEDRSLPEMTIPKNVDYEDDIEELDDDWMFRLQF
jgi:hypothetical protein